MAFRELHENELELLTDSQRKTYEEELAIYRERVRFVEQLEKLENTQIEAYEPMLTPIPSVRKAPQKRFAKSEHTVQKIHVVDKPVSRVKVIRVDPVTAPVLPKLSAPTGIRVTPVQKMEIDTPEIPTQTISHVPLCSVKTLDPVKAECRPAFKVQIPAVKQIRHDAVQVEVEAVEKPKFKTPENLTFEKVTVKPYSVFAPPVGVRVPDMAEQTPLQVKVPQIAVAFAQTREYHIVAPEMSALPEAAVIRCADISYARPDVSAATVDPVSVPVIPRRRSPAVDAVQPEVLAVLKPMAKVVEYTAPKRQEPMVPVRVLSARVFERTFKPVSRMEPQMVRHEPVDIPKKEYKKVGVSVRQVPKVAAVLIPDPHSNETIHALLRSAKK